MNFHIRQRPAKLMAAATVASLAVLSTSAIAADGKDFYKGKNVTYVVATAAGGGYDFYGRLIAGAMEKNLPGSTFVVRNLPGAGHLIGANFIANSKPDGLTIGTFNTGLIYNQLIALKGVRFDLSKMSWIGKAASDPRVIIMAAQSPIKSLDDLRKADHEVRFAVAGIGSAAYVEQVMLKNALNLPMKVITGYNGNADQLAMRRGEIEGGLGSLSSWQEFVQNGFGRFIAQIGGSEKAAPQLMTLIKDETARSLVALIQSQGDLSRFTVGPAGVPADRLAALRAAYRLAMADKVVQEKAAKSGRPLDPAYGEDVAKAIKVALEQSPGTIAILKEAMDAGNNVKLPEFVGTISTLADDNKDVTITLADGKAFKTSISGSRTKLQIGGSDAKRKALKIGMSCTVTAEKSGSEAKLIACK